MDLVSFIPGVGPTQSFSPGNTTPAPYNVNHTGMTDGTGPANSSSNMAEIYNRILLEIAATIDYSGIAIDHNNWAQLPAAVAAIAATVAGGTVGSGYVTTANYNNDFASQLTQNGFQRLKGGLILQWGRINGWTTENVKTVSFPMAFPNNCLNASTTIINPTGNNNMDQGAQVVGFTATQFSATIGFYGGGTQMWPADLYWMALGW